MASVDLCVSELSKVIWPKWKKVFQGFLRNKNFHWDEMIVTLNFIRSYYLFPSSDCFGQFFRRKAFNPRALHSHFRNKLPVIHTHILDKEVKARVQLHDSLNPFASIGRKLRFGLNLLRAPFAVIYVLDKIYL